MRSCPQCSNPCDEAHKFCPVCGFPISKIPKNVEDPVIGTSLPGGYVVLDLVGVGGMGRVYRAEQTNLGRTVAVKIIHPHLVGEENAAARFITEARAASLLNHPNSVAVIDFGKTAQGQLYLVMEFLRGNDMARVAYEEGPLPFRRIVDVLRQVLAALSEAHALGIIHRDLKPENIILEPTRTGADFVKVVDFGLAKMRMEVTSPSITSPGIVCGTPEYMSPEQGRGEPIDGKSDLYAVGVILYQLLTGRLPFEGESPTQVVLKHITMEPKDPRVVAPSRGIPETLSKVCLKALSKRATDRFPDADRFSAALLQALEESEPRRRGKSGGDGASAGIRCSSCGTVNAPKQKFCGECGTKLLVEAPPSTNEGAARKVPPPDGAAVRSSPRGSEGSFAGDRDEPGTLAGVAGPSDGVVKTRRADRFPLPLLGRADDLNWLDERRAEAETRLVGATLVGDAGVGKTRLLREFLAGCMGRGDAVVYAAPDPGGADVGYFALRTCITSLAGLPTGGGTVKDWVDAEPEARRGLSDIFVNNRGLSFVDLTPAERRHAVAEALRWAFERAAKRHAGRRIVVVLDDFQCVDGASRNAFADLLAGPSLAVPALVVAAHPPRFDSEIQSTHPLRVLTGIPVSSALPFLPEPTMEARAPFAGARTVAPLYVEQLIRFSNEHGGGAPSRLADLIALRVERLPADARRLLQAIAVLGDEATEDDILPLLPHEFDVVGAFGVLRSAGMVEETDRSLRTTHPLLREVVLASIPLAVRRQLHRAAYEVLEQSGAAVEILALHAYFAQSGFQAIVLLESVGGMAENRGDFQGAVLALRRCLELARRELVRGEIEDPLGAVLIFSRKLGEALVRAGAAADAEGVLLEALDLAGPVGAERARILAALARVAHERHRHEEAREHYKEALRQATRVEARDVLSSLEPLGRELAT